MNLRIAPLLLLALLPLVVGFSKKPKFSLTLHSQADDMDPKKTMFPVKIEGRDILFKIVPEFSQQNVSAFHPFDSDVGDKGVALQLDFRGRGSLEMVTRTRQGQFMLAMVNGRPVDYVVIDQVVDSGLFTIWRGVSADTVKEMDKKFPRIQPGGGAPSMSKEMDMAPTTKKEKEQALEAAKQAKRAAEKAKKAGKTVSPEIPSLEAPRAPTSNKIPLEGAGPATPAPSPGTAPMSEPNLPRP